MKFLACDSETAPILPGLLAPELVCVSFAWRTSTGEVDRVLHDAEGGIEVLRFALEDKNTTLIFHNGPYDLAVFAEHDPSLLPFIFQAYANDRIKDTMVREELKDIAEGRNEQGQVYRQGEWRYPDYSLNGLCKRYLGKDRSEDKHGAESWRLRYASLKHLPIEQWPKKAVEYALDDASDTLEVFEKLGPEMPTEPVQIRAAWALHLMSAWGVRTDAQMVAELKAKLLEEQAKNRKKLIKAGLLVPEKCTRAQIEEGKVDLLLDVVVKKYLTKEAEKRLKKAGELGFFPYDSDKQKFYTVETVKDVPHRYKKDTERLHAYIHRLAKRHNRQVKLTETHRVATDKDTLEATGSRLLKLLADGGGVDKLLTTYIPVLEQGTKVPINPRYRTLVNTGRTSSYSPNIQQLPTGKRVGGVRECFIPREGHLFVSVDYHMLEMTHIAQVCLSLFGESKMAEAINNGRDLHLVVAAQVLGTTYDDAKARYKKGDKDALAARNWGKILNFGGGGGAGAQSLSTFAWTSYRIRLSEEKAAEIKQEWLLSFPELRHFFKYVSRRFGFGEAVLVHPLTGFVRGSVGYTDGANTLFQNPAAHGGKLALFEIARECYVDESSPMFGSRPVAWVHDEVIMEVPEARAHEASYRLADVMIEQMRRITPDVKQQAEPALMGRWFKGAATVHDSNGRLIPWAPEESAA